MKGKFYLLTLLLCLAGTSVVVAGPPDAAQAKAELNVIKAVDVVEREDGTYITIQGTSQATYSVFKLHKPLRLFVDISNSRLDEGLRKAPRQIGNGVVGQIAMLEFSDDVQQIARLIVGFDAQATYDVRAEGDKIVVFVEGSSRGNAVADADGATLEERERQLERARRALGEKERRLAETERKVKALEEALQSATAGEGRDTLQRTLAAEQARASELRDELTSREERLARLEEVVSSERARASKLESELADVRGDQERLAAERDAAQKQAEKLAAERDAAQKRAESMATERDAARKESEALSKRTEQARARLDALEKDLERARKDLARAEEARQGAIASASKLRDEIAAMRGQLSAQDREADKLRAQVAELDRARATANKDNSPDLASIEREHKAKAAELARLEQRLDDVNRQIGSKEKALSDSVAQARRVEAQKEKAEAEADRVEAARRRELDESRKAEQERLAALEKSRKAEQERLAALEKSREAEQARLAQLEASRRAEQERLDETRDARQKEEARVASLRQEAANLEAARANAPGANTEATIDSRLTSVKETGDKAEVTLKQSAGSAIVETANTVKAVRFQQKGDVSRIVIELERPGNFETVPWKGGKASLRLDGVNLPRNLERTLDTQAFGGTVRFVSSYADDAGAVHVVAHVPSATTEIVRQDGARLIWEFSSIGAGEGVGTPEHAGAANPAPPAGFTAAPPNGASRATRSTNNSNANVPPWQVRPTRIARKRITLDLRGAGVDNVLRLIAREGNVNIVAGEKVKGTVTMRLDNVLLADAFVTVLKSLELGYEQDGEVIRVAPASVFEEAAKKRREDLIASFPLTPLEVVLMPINYANAGNVAKLVETVLSSRGSVTVDERTNTLVIKDVAQNLGAAQQLVLSLDTQTPQILIEARIVETNDQFTRQLGVQWGGDFLFSPANGNPTGLTFPSVVGVAGAATDGQTPLGGIVGTPNFAVNLPAAIGTGSGGGIGLTLGSLGGAGNLALRLTALENDGHIKIISAPRVLTMDNVTATISSGTSIPISVVSAAGVQTVFVEANLQLQVTPHVTQDGNVLLQLNIDKSEPDFANTGAAGDPSIIRRSANTELLVGDGDTTVIGGIFAHTTATGSNKVPFLADIPILGFFFRDYSESENRTELLIFVTPRIVNREAALDSRRLNPIDAPDVATSGGGGQ